MSSALAIQDLLEQRVTSMNQQALNRTASNGTEGRPAVNTQYWLAYEGSTFEPPSDMNYGEGFQHDRVMTFASYVEVQDFQRDFRLALTLSESLINLLDGFFPPLEGVQSPLVVIDHAPISVRTDRGPAYRYRARYRLTVGHAASTNPDPLPLAQIQVAIFRSPADAVGQPPPIATKDAEILVTAE